MAIDCFLNEVLDGAETFAATHEFAHYAISAGRLRLALEVTGALYAQRLTAGFAACRQGAGEGVRVIALDGAVTGLGAPPGWHFPVTGPSHLERLHERPGRGLAVRYDPDSQTWRIVSLERRLAVVWTADAARLPEWEDSAPLRDVIHFVSAREPWVLLHAACVGHSGRGVLLTGASGCGKSTTAAACAAAGMLTTGDDFVLVESKTAYALFNTVKLDEDSLALLPAWRAGIANPDRDPTQKARIHLTHVRPEALAPELALQAVLLPRVGHASRTTISPAAPGEAARALIPSTAFLLRGAATMSVRKAGALLHQLPTYRLDLGPDPAEAATIIMSFIK